MPLHRVCLTAVLVLLVLASARLGAADLGVGVKVTSAGPEVQGVALNSLGHQMKLRDGDLILAVNGKAVKSREDITREIGEKREITIQFKRPGEKTPRTIRGWVFWLAPEEEKKGSAGGKKKDAGREARTQSLFWSKGRPKCLFVEKK